MLSNQELKELLNEQLLTVIYKQNSEFKEGSIKDENANKAWK